MSRKLLKSTSTVGAMTLLSRISGLLRDMVLANVLAAGRARTHFLLRFVSPSGIDALPTPRLSGNDAAR